MRRLKPNRRQATRQSKPLTPFETQLLHLSPNGFIDNNLRQAGFFKLPPEGRERVYSLIFQPEIMLYLENILTTNECIVNGSRLSKQSTSASDRIAWGVSTGFESLSKLDWLFVVIAFSMGHIELPERGSTICSVAQEECWECSVVFN